MERKVPSFIHFRSFRIKVDPKDRIGVYAEILDSSGQTIDKITKNIQAQELNLSTFTFQTNYPLGNFTPLKIRLYSTGIFGKWDLELSGVIVRSFSSHYEKQLTTYVIHLNESLEYLYFLKHYIAQMGKQRIRKYLTDSALMQKEIGQDDAIEIFQLMLSIYSDLLHLETPNAIEELLAKSRKFLQASRTDIYLINHEKEKLENIFSTQKDKLPPISPGSGGLSGSFTHGEILGLQNSGVPTLSAPLYDKDKTIIGLICAQRSQDSFHFTYQDEKSIRLLSMLFSHFILQLDETYHRKFRPRWAYHTKEELTLGNKTSIHATEMILERLKNCDGPLLIVGEEGVGKSELVAKMHHEGPFHTTSLLTIDCEKFRSSHERTQQFDEGLDEKGILFIKNIEILSPPWQKHFFEKLLFTKRKVICSTRKDLHFLSKQGNFLWELYELISQHIIVLKPLRNYGDETLAIAEDILKKECFKRNIAQAKYSEETKRKILEYQWPGNFKELKQEISKALLKKQTKEVNLNIKSNRPTQLSSQLVFHADKWIPLDQHLKLIKQIIRKKKVA